ncbi:MAG: DUF1476 domain-containing protein [Rhodobacteraceae bacterium]|nr:DUF1476 domain-containing protein [Paracoccaceae bacterium]
MTTFDKREDAYENKFVHDEELKFKAAARRNKLLAVWAAEKLGIEDVAQYTKDVIRSDFEEAGHEDVFRKVFGDFKEKGVAITDEELHKVMNELMATAVVQVQAEG